MKNGNRTVALLAYVGLAVTVLLWMMALLRIWAAGPEPRSRARGLCTKAGMPGESQELGRCIEERLADSVLAIAMPWAALGLTALVVTITLVEVVRRRTASTGSSRSEGEPKV